MEHSTDTTGKLQECQQLVHADKYLKQLVFLIFQKWCQRKGYKLCSRNREGLLNHYLNFFSPYNHGHLRSYEDEIQHKPTNTETIIQS